KKQIASTVLEIEDYVKRNKNKKKKRKEIRKEIRKERNIIRKKRREVVEKTINATKTGLVVDEMELVGSVCKDSFYEFVKEFWSVIVPEKPVWNWHIEYLCNELQKIAERVFQGKPKLYDLVVNIP